MRVLRIVGIVGLVLVLLVAGGVWYVLSGGLAFDPFMPIYAENCAVCHGEHMQGASQGPALVGAPLQHGDSVDAIEQSIAEGFPQAGMPPWRDTLDEGLIRSLALLVAERRVNREFVQMRMDTPLVLPEGVVETERARFRVETVAEDIAPYPFSVAALPDGRILVTEKQRGLSVIEPDGTRIGPLEGAPEVSTVGLNMSGLEFGIGWHLDVAPHPDYARNGWIYLHHTHICHDCEKSRLNPLPVTMNRVVRGRIEGNRWVDEEVIWQVPKRFYNSQPDIGAGGRLAFDDRGHVFISVGIKGGYFEGIQDLSTPYGKIHRVSDDGHIPDDNPYAHDDAAMASVWTVGHRSPQGLEFEPRTGSVWQAEMGPRGGDEVNLLLPGHNYGWPLRSLGVDYDGTPVEYGEELGLDPDDFELDEPVVDFSPSPAISSFVIYEGDAFPGWRGSFLVGSLKASTLYRVTIEDGRHTGTETLLEDLARIRDVELDHDGRVLLLLEHANGSRIVRLVPADD